MWGGHLEAGARLKIVVPATNEANTRPEADLAHTGAPARFTVWSPAAACRLIVTGVALPQRHHTLSSIEKVAAPQAFQRDGGVNPQSAGAAGFFL